MRKENIHTKEVRDKIIQVSAKLFSLFGFKKTTVEEIAEACQKGKNSIYLHFKNKEEIFTAVVDKEASQLRNELMNLIGGIEDPVEKLSSYIVLRMSKLKEVSNYYNALKNEYLSHYNFIEIIRKKYDMEELGIIEDILISGVDKNEFTSGDTFLQASAIFTAIKGLEFPLIIYGSDNEVKKRMEKLVEILLFGIVKR